MGIRASIRKFRTAANSSTGMLGLILFAVALLLFAWRLAGDVEFLVNNWSAIESILKDWGPLIGLIVSALLIAKAIYDTSGADSTKNGKESEVDHPSLSPADTKLIANIGVSAIDRPHERMFVIFDAMLDKGFLAKENPQLAVYLSAFNAHFHWIRIKELRGRFKFAGDEIPGDIDFLCNSETITYGDYAQIALRQWIPAGSAQKIREDAKSGRLVLVTNFVHLIAEAVNPRTTEVVGEFRIPLPSQLQFDTSGDWRAAPPYHDQAQQR